MLLSTKYYTSDAVAKPFYLDENDFINTAFMIYLLLNCAVRSLSHFCFSFLTLLSCSPHSLLEAKILEIDPKKGKKSGELNGR